MKILFDINHPADVHQFRNIIKILSPEHTIIIIARKKKDSVEELLRYYQFRYYLRPGYNGILGRLLGLLTINFYFLRKVWSLKPDILVGSSGDIYVAQIAWLCGKPSIIIDDTEHTTFQNFLTFPFATLVITPESYKINIGKKQLRYPGTKEFGYLSRKYFQPDRSLIGNLTGKGSGMILIRLISWNAGHDVNRSSTFGIQKLIEFFSNFGKVVISSESAMPPSLASYQMPDNLKIHLHHVLYFSDLVISEGATTAVEAAILGTPAIYANKLKMGYTSELIRQKRLYQITDEKEILLMGKQLLTEGRKEILSNDFDINLLVINKIFELTKNENH
jgi:predicted glycosyltransferase